MANTLALAIPALLAQGLLALRQMALMPRYINRAYEGLAGEKGGTISVPIPSAITAAVVAPSNVLLAPATVGATTPTSAIITLNQWWEASFFMTDNDLLQAIAGIIPMQASEGVKALANQVDQLVLTTHNTIYGWGGTAGTTPFATDLAEFLDARKALNTQLAPFDPRYVVMNADAEANALGLRAFQDASFRGDTAGILNGEIGRKLGSTWFVDQNVQTHTAGTAAGAGTTAAGFAAGVVQINLQAQGAGTILAGDVFTIAGDAQTYVADGTGTGCANVGAGGTVNFTPPLAVTIGAAITAITLKQTHVVNLAFQRDYMALASRPFSGADPLGLGFYQSAVDPVSGLTLRLEVQRQHKQTLFSYDILYGLQVVRPQFAARIAG